MMRARPLLARFLLCLCLAPLSCDKPKASTPAADTTVPIPQLQVDALAQLAPNRLTHVAVDVSGNLYWSQETDDGQDVMYVIGAAGGDEAPRATLLTSDTILSAMPPVNVPEKPQATPGKSRPNRRGGAIQSIAPGIDGELYFYFTGGVGPVTRCCLGRFEPRTGEVRILADASHLASVSGMGLSISLARGQVISTGGQRVRLLLRHSDDWVIFEFDSRRVPSSGPPAMYRPFERIVAAGAQAGQARELNLCSEMIDVSAGAGDDELLVSDRGFGALYRVDREGQASMIASLILLPQPLSPPTAARLKPIPHPREPWPPPATAPSSPDAPDANGRVASILLFAADGREIDPANSARPDAADVQTPYPALLVWQAGRYRPIARDNLRAGAAVTTYTLRLRELVPFGRDTWAGYDAASGQIMRVKLFERR